MTMNFKDKKIAILGLGVAGKAAAKWLNKKKAIIRLIDDGQKGEFLGRSIISSKKVSDRELNTFDLIIVSPGIKPSHPIIQRAQKNNLPVIGELYLAASIWKGPLIGITGTNGKTTTTLLTSHILSKIGVKNVFAGNISPPLFDLMDQNENDVCAVLEISSFQLTYFPELNISGIKKPRFRAAACLNIAPDHLDWHKDLKEYQEAKLKIFSFQDRGDFSVIGRGIETFGKNINGQKFFLKELVSSIEYGILTLKIFNNIEKYNLSKWLQIHKGEHNLDNLISSIICARALSNKKEKIEKAFHEFALPKHRLEFVQKIREISFIDDSKATNIHALKAAISALKNNIILIAGGKGKGENFSELIEFLSQPNGNKPIIKACIFIGEEAKNLYELFKNKIANCFIIKGKDGTKVMEEAVRAAFELAEKGDKVLLSPACASFDLYSNYKQRGEAFKRAVMQLKEKYE